MKKGLWLCGLKGALGLLIHGMVGPVAALLRSEEHTSELQSHHDLVCRLLLEKKQKMVRQTTSVPVCSRRATYTRREDTTSDGKCIEKYV